MKKKTMVRIFFIITLITFIMMEKQLKTMTDISTILDMKIFYNEGFVLKLFNTLGNCGREMYLNLHKVDYLFILGLGSIQFLLLNEKLTKANNNIKIKNWYFIIPIVLRGVVDIGENLTIDVMLSSYPDINLFLVKIAYTFTFLKWIFLTLFIIEMGYLIILGKGINIPVLKREKCR